jgi:hypothetical protein
MSPPPAGPLLDEAARLQDEAARRHLVLKLAGSAGVLQHCQACQQAVADLGREPPGDLDFFAYRKQHRDLARMFTDQGYQADPSVAFSQEYGIDRLIYLGQTHAAKIDVFLDALRRSHTIEFQGRLDHPGPTASATDLLLTKLQIHQITEKDVQDIAALLAAHPVTADGEHSIDVPYISRVMARDWGFCHTTQANLETAHRILAGSRAGPAAVAAGRIAELRERIDAAPKSLRWKARARVGTRVRWYEEVGDAALQGQGSAGEREG